MTSIGNDNGSVLQTHGTDDPVELQSAVTASNADLKERSGRCAYFGNARPIECLVLDNSDARTVAYGGRLRCHGIPGQYVEPSEKRNQTMTGVAETAVPEQPTSRY